MKAKPDCLFLKLDIVNAYNRMPREMLLAHPADRRRPCGLAGAADEAALPKHRGGRSYAELLAAPVGNAAKPAPAAAE